MGEENYEKWNEIMLTYIKAMDDHKTLLDSELLMYNDFKHNWSEMPIRAEVIRDVIRGCEAGLSGFKEAFQETINLQDTVIVDVGDTKARFCYHWNRAFAYAVLERLYNIEPLNAAKTSYDLGVRKHRDYGNANITGFGELGIIVRVCDKISRIFNLLQSGGTVEFESITDTLYDIINYCTYGMMLQDGTWVS